MQQAAGIPCGGYCGAPSASCYHRRKMLVRPGQQDCCHYGVPACQAGVASAKVVDTVVNSSWTWHRLIFCLAGSKAETELPAKSAQAQGDPVRYGLHLPGIRWMTDKSTAINRRPGRERSMFETNRKGAGPVCQKCCALPQMGGENQYTSSNPELFNARGALIRPGRTFQRLSSRCTTQHSGGKT